MGQQKLPLLVLHLSKQTIVGPNGGLAIGCQNGWFVGQNGWLVVETGWSKGLLNGLKWVP